MREQRPKPGVSRENRLSAEGLIRLEKQLTSGAGLSDMVLAQWIRRYGNAARELIRKHHRDSPAFDDAMDQ
jgi:hypothetical protein